MMFRLSNDRFTFWELKNDEKVYVDGFVFLHIHISESNFDKYLEPWKDLTIFKCSKPLQKCLTSVTFGHLS